ncbi:MAG: class I SAM-dependent methyltransferase [Candidatus Aquilonibacter sp.]
MTNLEPLKDHFRRLLGEHEDPARACSWRDEDVARRNFASIAQVFAHETEPFTVYEIGCGVATLSEFLAEYFPLARYSGSDILSEMVERAKTRNPGVDVEQRDVIANPPSKQYDYVLISGVFNLRMSNDDASWFEFVKTMSRAAFGIAHRGYASNFLTSYVDWKRELGYYQDPSAIFDFAQRELSRFSEIRHSYYPWEFTLFVYRSPKALPFAPPPVSWPPETGEPDSRTF